MKIIFFILLATLPVQTVKADESTGYGPIIISEIGAYEASDYEWVEIYNSGEQPIDLTDWKFFEDQTNHGLKSFQGDLSIDADEYAIIANKPEMFKEKYSDFNGTIIDSSWSSLKEDGEELGLKDSQLKVIEVFTYQPSPGTSLQKINLNIADYSSENWKPHSTSNSIGRINEFTEVTIEETQVEQEIVPTTTEDETSNIQNDELIEDNEIPLPENIVEKSNTATPVSGSTIETEKIKKPSKSAKTKAAPKPEKPKIIINEIFPNPFGSDTNYEFIELKNLSEQNVNLKNWSLTNRADYRYLLPELVIYPKSVIVLSRSQSRLALNNYQEELSLYDQDKKQIDKVKYKMNFADNVSYQLINNEWKQTAQPTKGQENQDFPINLPPVIEVTCDEEIEPEQSFICDASDSFDPNGDNLTFSWALEGKELPTLTYYDDLIELIIDDQKYNKLTLTASDGILKYEKEIKLKFKKPAEYKISAETATKKSGTKTSRANPIITVQAKLTVPPGVLGKNEAYLEFPGKKLILSRGNWPELKAGDEIKVTGKLGKEKSMAKITIAKSSDIKIISSNPPPEPIPTKLEELSDKYLGSLIKLDGVISELGDNDFILTAETKNISVYLKRSTKISTKNLHEGEKVTIAGILQKFGEDYQLLPRSSADIISEIKPTVVKTEPKNSQLAPVKKKSPSWIYILGAIAGVGALFYKIRELTPAAVQVDGMAAGPNQEKEQLSFRIK